MTRAAQIKQMLQEISRNTESVLISAKVEKLDGSTCSVKLPGGLTISDVRLKATAGEDVKFLIRPKVGSTVKMIQEGPGIDQLVVVIVDEIQDFEIKTQGIGFLFDADDNKFKLYNSSSNFLDLILDLTDKIKQLKVSTPSGPSGVPLPDTIAALNQFETAFKQLFK